jgi:acyl-CoA dehydrogenase
VFAGVVTAERLAAADRGEWPAAIWDAVEQAGLPLALVPEAQGGVGLAPAAAFLLMRRAGYHALPVPLAETMMGAALWSQAAGTAVAGTLTMAPTSPSDTMRIGRSGDGYILHGSVDRVPWGARAGHALVFARAADESGYLALLPQGSGRAAPYRNLANEPRDTLTVDGVTLPAHAVRPAPPSCLAGLVPFGALIRAQQMAGAMERCLDHACATRWSVNGSGAPSAGFRPCR